MVYMGNQWKSWLIWIYYGEKHDLYNLYLLPFWLFNIAMGNDPFIDGLPFKNGDFPWQTVSHNQMVYGFNC